MNNPYPPMPDIQPITTQLTSTGAHPKPKLCIDCKHLVQVMGARSCKHGNNIERSLVDGELRGVHSADYLRHDARLCGPRAMWFEGKAEKPF